MTATVHQLLADALLARLQSQLPLAAGRVHANRLVTLSQGRALAVVLRRESAVPREIVLGGFLDWTSVFAVESYGRGQVGEDPARAVDDLLSQVWACLFSLTPADLPGLGVMDIGADRSIDWNFGEAETPLACAIVRFTVRHRARAADLQP